MPGELKSGRFEREREIGHGGMGLVYRALDTKLGRIVALKMVPPELLHDAQLSRRLAQEVRAASAINHPGVATVFDFVEEEEEKFIVYEYVDGATLRQRMHEHRFTTVEILEIGMQTAEALAAAHERGIIHRDIKPENIMLAHGSGSPGRVKIIDFGLAKLRQPLGTLEGHPTSAQTGPLTTTGTLLVGTVNYMAPEQLAAEPVDARTDVYAVGLVLYEIAAGINPFVGETATSTIANILTRDAPPLSERNPLAPPELDRVVRKCLRKPKEERYQSAGELRVDLSNLQRALTQQPGAPSAQATAPTPEPPLTISRGVARALFLLIQLGYLAMYGVAAQHLHTCIQRFQMLFPVMSPPPAFPLLALCGTAVHLYLLAAVGFDYPDSGRLFRPLFPGLLLLDAAWAVTPLFLYKEIGPPSILFVVGLVFLPFCQRTLLFSAYAPRGGRTSGLRLTAPF